MSIENIPCRFIDSTDILQSTLQCHGNTGKNVLIYLGHIMVHGSSGMEL